MTNTPNYGITVEDLEKAASVRLFEKAAAAEGINLNQLSSSEVDELYYNYQQSSEENTMNDQIFDLFEKQAAYEGVDLESLSDEELAYVFNNFVENMSNDGDAEAVNEFLSEKTAAVYDLLMRKEAGIVDSAKGYAAAGVQKAKNAGSAAVQMAKNNPKSAIGAGLATAGLAGYGAKKMYDKRKAKAAMEKEAAESTMLEAFDSFLVNNHGVSSDQLDEDTFNNTYNEFLDMVANDVVTEAAEEEDAYEKLAEAEILGRHMARAYMDEMEKEAGMMGKAMDKGREILSGLTGSRVRKLQEAGKSMTGDLLDYNNEALASAKKYSRNVRLGAAGGLAVAGAGGYGAKKMYDKRKASQEAVKEAAAFDIAFDLFSKEASSIGIDLSDLYEDELGEFYSEFINYLDDDTVDAIDYSAEKVAAIALTDAGHELEAARGNADLKRALAYKASQRQYNDEMPLFGDGMAEGVQELRARNAQYRAKKHGDKRQSLNPFGGMLTPIEKAAGIALTDAGHGDYARKAKADKEYNLAMKGANRAYLDKNPILGRLSGKGLAALRNELGARHAQYIESKHGDKRQALNPFGGYFTKVK